MTGMTGSDSPSTKIFKSWRTKTNCDFIFKCFDGCLYRQ
ncbi:unnamed protein product [Tenebrio molitor]|nr:unnamed protein product [Tenebrio molitor]